MTLEHNGTETIANTPAAGDAVDSGLHCPHCEYNLTGLTEPRCPECGERFTWEAVRQAATARPTIAFERASGWHKLWGFVKTWLTVMFAPWIFARQAAKAVDARHATAFGALCVASTSISFLFENTLPYFAAWFVTAAICITVEACLLALLDRNAWRRPLQALGFWLCIGAYTSAVMLTEFGTGPPIVEISAFFSNLMSGRLSFERGLLGDLRWWSLAQLGLWIIPLVLCYYARQCMARVRLRVTLPLLPLIAFALFVLYGVLVEFVGVQLYGLFGGPGL